MLKHLIVCLAASLHLSVVAQSLSVAETDSPKMLRGIISLDEPASQGSITISSGSEVLQTQTHYNFTNNTFAVSLKPETVLAMSSKDARITVQITNLGAQNVDLTADVHAFDPDRAIVFLNPVSSIVSSYRDLNPSATLDDAEAQVGRTLGVGSLPQSPHTLDFDSHSFMIQSESSGGFDDLVKQVAGEVRTGAPLSVPRMTQTALAARTSVAQAAVADLSPGTLSPMAVTAAAAAASSPDFGNLFLALSKDLVEAALETVPLGKVVSGWILDEVFKAASGSSGGPDINAQLLTLGSQQQAVLDGISGLATQIGNLQTTITDQLNLQNYQIAARQAKASSANILDMQSQLLYLTQAGVTAGDISFVTNLRTRIQNEATANLRNIWDLVEGDNLLHLPGLIDLWYTAVGVGPGAPIFTSNINLKKAAPLEIYWFGIETIGLNLEMELAHSLESTQPALAKQIIDSTYKDFNNHHDIEMKLLAHNRGFYPINYGSRYASPSLYYVARVLPDSFDSLTIDTRTGLLWELAHGGTFQAYPSNPPNGFPTLEQAVAQKNSSFQSGIPNVNVTFHVPSRYEWNSLVGRERESNAEDNMIAGAWLNSKGFYTYYGVDKLSYWTADVAKMNDDVNPHTFPAWDNYVIDLNKNAAGIIWYLVLNNPNDPIRYANLLLCSDTTKGSSASGFLYYTGQDVFPLK